MFEKKKLKKAIEKSKARIADIEQRRSRSQAALVDAILRHVDPDDKDVDYFNQFTAQVDEEREHLHQLMEELNKLS